MIAIELRDFRGCERASLRVDPIALVAGRNATGKSSIAQAIGAALAGEPLVLEGLAKASAARWSRPAPRARR
jgi:predicted ATP-dependent endonuclease of OLD family